MNLPYFYLCIRDFPTDSTMLITADTPREELEKWVGSIPASKRARCVGELISAGAGATEPHAKPRTPVLLLAHNSERYLREVLPLMMRHLHDGCAAAGVPPPRLYIYENDSTDGTQALLKHLGRTSDDTVVVLDNRPAALRPRGHRSSTRCGPMADMRNTLAHLARRDLLAPTVTCGIVFDTEVWFKTSTVTELVTGLDKHTLDVATPMGLVGSHYYDTYALVRADEDPDFAAERNDCFLDSCTDCASMRRKGRAPPPRCELYEVELVELVQSAFGGIAAIRADALKEGGWAACKTRCEHVAFCHTKRVGIVASAPARWVPESTPSNVWVNNLWASGPLQSAYATAAKIVSGPAMPASHLGRKLKMHGRSSTHHAAPTPAVHSVARAGVPHHHPGACQQDRPGDQQPAQPPVRSTHGGRRQSAPRVPIASRTGRYGAR